jgi:preprotein translocase subunit SecB
MDEATLSNALFALTALVLFNYVRGVISDITSNLQIPVFSLKKSE